MLLQVYGEVSHYRQRMTKLFDNFKNWSKWGKN